MPDAETLTQEVLEKLESLKAKYLACDGSQEDQWDDACRTMDRFQELALTHIDHLIAAARERDELKETLASVETNVSKVYRHITDGKMSKANYDADTVIAVADDVDTAVCMEARREAVEECLKLMACSECTAAARIGMYFADVLGEKAK